MAVQPKLVSLDLAKQLVAEGSETIFWCFQCGTCSASCPSGRVTNLRTRKLIRMAQLGFRDEILPSDELWLCTTCYTCYERCPRGVNAPDIILTLRNLALKEGYIADPHRRTALSVIQTGMSVPLRDQDKQARKSLGLAEIPPTTLAYPRSLDQLRALVSQLGFDQLIQPKP